MKFLVLLHTGTWTWRSKKVMPIISPALAMNAACCPCGDHWERGVPWHGTQISAVWHQGIFWDWWIVIIFRFAAPLCQGKGPFNCTFRIIRQVITDRCMLHIECECIAETLLEQLCLCVKESMLCFVLINSRSFEPFMCLDPLKNSCLQAKERL